MSVATDSSKKIIDAVEAVTDPEIPVLTIADLGILRSVTCEPLSDGGVDGVEAGGTAGAEALRAHVVITPTYSGCPAMETIKLDVQRAARAAGAAQVDVELVYSPAWSTDWISPEGKAKLEQYGIAPPTGMAAAGPVTLGLSVKCPHCHSLKTTELSRFGSTSCKALYRCLDCLEPFDYFKVH